MMPIIQIYSTCVFLKFLPTILGLLKCGDIREFHLREQERQDREELNGRIKNLRHNMDHDLYFFIWG